MAGTASFDVSTGADLQEVDNAVNQALKEISQRYDFKGTHVTIEFDRTKAVIKLHADDEFRMKQVLEVVEAKCAKRGVPLKNLKTGEMIPGAGTSVRCEIALTQGIPQDIAKKIQKAIKEHGFKKVQASIQGDELRITSPSKDELQSVMAFLRSQDFELELKFGNFRG
jgi:cyclic-di-GMP-binding protein